MQVSALQELLARASREQGYNVSIGFYANGGIYVDGVDCKGSFPKAVDHLESLVASKSIVELARSA